MPGSEKRLSKTNSRACEHLPVPAAGVSQLLKRPYDTRSLPTVEQAQHARSPKTRNFLDAPRPGKVSGRVERQSPLIVRVRRVLVHRERAPAGTEVR